MTENTEAYDIKVISSKSRFIKTFAIAIPTLSLSILAALSVINGSVLNDGFLLSLILVLVGSYFSWKVFTTKEIKTLTGRKVSVVNHNKRKKVKVAVCIGGLVLLATALVLYKLDTPLSEYIAMFVMVGITLGFYAFSAWSPEVVFVLTAAATKEQQRIDELNAIKAAEYSKKEEWVMAQWWFRYPAAFVMIAGSAWLYDIRPKLWWVSVVICLVAMVYTWEISLLAICLGLGWLMVKGVAALPVAAAIIIGALIIASAINK